MAYVRIVACSLLLGITACGSSTGGGGGCPPDAGQCGLGGGNTGGFGNTGNTGNTGGFGNTGNTGGFGNTGNTGNTGGFGNTGNTGGFGNTGNTGGFGNSGGSGGSGGGTFNPNLGRACATQAECGTGLSCITANSGAFDGEGPAKGYCTVDCTNDDTICSAIDSGAICLAMNSGDAYCFEGCSFGPDTLTAFDPNKCHGRQEVACAPVDEFGTAACLPTCNSNADCGGTLKCSPETGSCSTTTPTGLALGQTCVQPPTGGVDPCKGNCTGFQDSSGSVSFYMCTENCTLGAAPSCGWTGPGTGPAPAACLYVSTIILDNGGAGIGDRGSCGNLCDCNAQCNSNLVCNAWTGPNAQATKDFFQRNGYCGEGGGSGITTCN
jgi:hypothetical protein